MNNKIRFIWIAASVLGVFSLANAAIAESKAPTNYQVTLQRETFPIAHVEAELEINNGLVQMTSSWATFFDNPRGWASFVTIKSAQTDKGDMLDVVEQAPFGWNIGNGFSGTVHISYEVDFSFANLEWPVGNEQVALIVGNALYTTGLPLFAHSPDMTDALIRFSVPDGDKVTTAWPEQDGAFHADNLDQLLSNAIVIGDHYEALLDAKHFELRIALLGEIAQSGKRVENAASDIASYFVQLMDEQEIGQYLMVMLPGPNDGEGYANSFASSQPTAPSKEDQLIWAGSMTHEFFHYWNGDKFSADAENEEATEWFSEGFTEYFSLLALRDLKLIDQRTYEELLSQYFGYHAFFALNPNYKDITIKAAGARNWTNRPGVYDSGVVAAFCLDSIIQKESNGDRDLSDVMKIMNRRFGVTRTKYAYEDIITAASDVAGRDMTPFFAKFIEGKKSLPMKKCAADMGYGLIADVYHYILRRK